ncbi:glycosyltransferase [Desulfobacterota bacterium AH_259_B03_O07]|nr:glycosyltransferase [Desulfobacterota bacterium AH_259_B03_O07]
MISKTSSLVSVVIPCYNQAHYLSDAIESVLAQSYTNFEIVVVDDGSIDNTFQVASSYTNVNCIRQNNLGLSAARNTGLHHSKGRYLIFLDADDHLLPKAIESGLESMKAHPECAFVYGHHKCISSEGSSLYEFEKDCVNEDHYIALLKRNFISMPATVMYRREILEIVGGFNIYLNACEDYDLYLRIARKFSIACHDAVVAEYRRHGMNMSLDSARMLKSALSVLRSQWICIRGKKKYEDACKIGIKFWKDYYGEQLLIDIIIYLKDRELNKSMKNLLVLLRYSPRTFLKLPRIVPRYFQRLIGRY